MNVLGAWYARISSTDVLELVPAERRQIIQKRIAKATASSSSDLVFPKLVEAAGTQPRIRDSAGRLIPSRAGSSMSASCVT